jgi:dienelactone hydrolase
MITREIAVALCAAACAAAGVQVENGKRTTARGDTIEYDLYLPEGQRAVPAVILTHGFGRSRKQHADTARFLAESGMVVLVPNMVSLFGGKGAQAANVENTVDHIVWLRERSAREGDLLKRQLDPERIALAGHSAGGAVSFDAVVSAQKRGVPVAGVVLLDAVPWPETVDRARQARQVPIASLRSEPSMCNGSGSVSKLLDNLSFRADDIKIRGATHCDPEGPTNLLCRVPCGGSSAKAQETYRRLMFLFLRDLFGLPRKPGDPVSYELALEQFEREAVIGRRANAAGAARMPATATRQ